MTVSVRFAKTSFGDPVALPEDVGTLSPGDASSIITFYISHDGTSSITDCKFYVLPYSAGVYLGAETSQDDYEELLAWGDADPAPAGGLFINMNYTGGFPTGSFEVIKTGTGDSLGTAVSLPAAAISTGVAIAGEIAPLGEASIQVKVVIPATYTDTGAMYTDLLMYYSATS